MTRTEKYNCCELITPVKSTKILIKTGALWLTYFNEAEDILLLPGDWHEIDLTKKPVLQTLKESEVTFELNTEVQNLTDSN